MLRFGFVFLFSIAAFGEEPSPALLSAPRLTNQTWVAQVLRNKPEDRKIEGLSVLADELSVSLVPQADKLRPFTELSLRYNHPGWILFAQERQVTQPNQRATDLKIPLYLNGRVNQIILSAKGPGGETENETLFVVAPNAQEFSVINPWDRILISGGITSLSYFQSRFGTYTSLSGLVGIQYASPYESRFGLFLSLDVNAITLAESPMKVGAEIVEAKADFAYAIKQNDLKSLWRHQLLGGVSFLTMYSNGAPFGFANLLAPEIGVRSRYLKNSRDAYIIDIRYTALSAPTDLGHRGLNFSFGFSRILPSFHRIEPSIGYSSYFFAPESERTVHVDVITLRIGYSL